MVSPRRASTLACQEHGDRCLLFGPHAAAHAFPRHAHGQMSCPLWSDHIVGGLALAIAGGQALASAGGLAKAMVAKRAVRAVLLELALEPMLELRWVSELVLLRASQLMQTRHFALSCRRLEQPVTPAAWA